MATNKNGQSAKNVDQKLQTVDWASMPKYVKEAVTAETASARKWTSLSDRLWMLGVRPTALDPVLVGEKYKPSETYTRIEKMVIASWSVKVQGFMDCKGAALSGLSEVERAERRYYAQRTVNMMSIIRKHLGKHEENDGKGPAAKKTTQEVLLPVVVYWIKRLKDGEEKITGFDTVRVGELLAEIKAELT